MLVGCHGTTARTQRPHYAHGDRGRRAARVLNGTIRLGRLTLNRAPLEN